jgi:hypothetical protein
MPTTGSTLEVKHDMESETVASESELQPFRQPNGLCGMSRAMILLVSVLIAIIVGLSITYATDIDPTSIVFENCVNNTDFGVVDGGSGRDLLCFGGVRSAARISLSSARASCYNQFYVGGCYNPYTLNYYKLRYGAWIVNCACNC